ncbi:phytase [Candidatus Uabimicrobium amorphum]|uniref:3-phytase n=1 Tax=Uabimicrobium amorphum TaxID=2596890 RepID=A0A5S9F4H7_UABAM|nr:phytase [Candidatus Uabimicrobium amorphum]BBM85562.1 3-phytase [Candidatus Uabimicrobium amorphum]
MNTKKILLIIVPVICVVAFFFSYEEKKRPVYKKKGVTVTSDFKYGDASAQDQDDMCIWIHPRDEKQSLIISADKEAHKLFVYDMSGKVLQTVPCYKPGNIDVRYNFPLGEKKIDIVVTTTRRKKNIILVFQMDSENLLKRIDDGSGLLESVRSQRKSFGGTLYHDRTNNKFYFIKTDEDASQSVEQFEICSNPNNQVSLKKVREWDIDEKCEGAAADDENEAIYICEEKRGVWKISTDLTKPVKKELLPLPDNTHVSLEGVTIYKTSPKDGYIIVSLQSHSSYLVYDRVTNKYITVFHLQDGKGTDGVDVTPISIHPEIEGGVFVCHSMPLPPNYPILLTSWKKIAEKLQLQYKSSYKVR